MIYDYFKGTCKRDCRKARRFLLLYPNIIPIFIGIVKRF